MTQMHPTVPVLMYHHVSPLKNDMVSVTPSVFEGQMRYIKDAGYQTLSLDELIGFMEGSFKPDRKSVVITFDDGYLDNYIYAYPVLKACGLKAAVFLVSDWADMASLVHDKEQVIDDYKKRPLSHAETKALVDKGALGMVSVDWQMVREMMGSTLIEFHSHTKSHRSVDRLDRAELTLELSGSKRRIEEMLKMDCTYLCWPKGRFTAEAVDAAAGVGYKGIFTTMPGVTQKGGDPLHIKRIVVKDSVAWLKLRLAIYTNPVLARAYLALRRKRG